MQFYVTVHLVHDAVTSSDTSKLIRLPFAKLFCLPDFKKNFDYPTNKNLNSPTCCFRPPSHCGSAQKQKVRTDFYDARRLGKADRLACCDL